MSLRTTLAAGFSVALLGAQVTAIMMMPDIRKVPVDRLLGNLERVAKENPAGAQPQLNLARLHAMAYALKSDTLPAVNLRSGDKSEIPYYPPGSTVPESVHPAPTAGHAAKAGRPICR